MAAKGMSTSLVLIVAAIVILITALVVVTVFGGGMQNFLGFLNPWASQTTALAQCQGMCQQLCLTHSAGGQPPGWTEVEITVDNAKKKCTEVTGASCDCSVSSFGINCPQDQTWDSAQKKCV